MTILASSPSMSAKLALIAPEILLLAGAVLVAVLGLSRNASLRRAVPLVTGLFLVGSIVVSAIVTTPERSVQAGLLMPMLGGYAKALIASIGLLLVMVAGPSIDRRLEAA